MTIDVMLSDPGVDFTGGAFTTPELCAKYPAEHPAYQAALRREQAPAAVAPTTATTAAAAAAATAAAATGGAWALVPHAFNKGDALCFASHKRHCVQVKNFIGTEK